MTDKHIDWSRPKDDSLPAFKAWAKHLIDAFGAVDDLTEADLKERWIKFWAGQEIEGIDAAAKYLGFSAINLKKHLAAKRLRADRRAGKNLIFKRGTLDAFKAINRPAHRPKTK